MIIIDDGAFIKRYHAHGVERILPGKDHGNFLIEAKSALCGFGTDARCNIDADLYHALSSPHECMRTHGLECIQGSSCRDTSNNTNSSDLG